jgi:hypothetical protein
MSDGLLLRLNDVAVGATRHQTILHLARRRQLARKPHPDSQEHNRDRQSCNSRRAIFPGFAILVGLGAFPDFEAFLEFGVIHRTIAFLILAQGKIKQLDAPRKWRPKPVRANNTTQSL